MTYAEYQQTAQPLPYEVLDKIISKVLRFKHKREAELWKAAKADPANGSKSTAMLEYEVSELVNEEAEGYMDRLIAENTPKEVF